MFRPILLSGFFLVVGTPALAQGVEPRVHEMCSEAKDYAGCVRAMTTDVSAPPVQRLINSQGADIAEGNRCPASYAYVGGGNCQRVTCFYPRRLGGGERGHDPIVAGKPGWGCKGMGLFSYAGVLRLGETARATNDPSCPAGEPKIGYNSTCTISSLTTNGNGGKADTSDWDSSPNDYVLDD